MAAKFKAQFGVKSRYGLVLALIFSLALFLRVYPRLDAVFGQGWTRFGEVDPWYHIRLLENLLQHFPHQINFDPYTFFPHGQAVAFAPFFDLVLGFLVWIIGLGSPSLQTIETVAAYFPAILGALTTLAVFFVTAALFNRRVGLVAAALMAFIPGNFLARSLLGITDHHVAEVLLTTLIALFLLIAIGKARDKTSLRDIINGNWRAALQPLVWSCVCGLVLGIYVDTWVGGLLFVLILFIYMILQILLDHLLGHPAGYLSLVAVPLFIMALIAILPFIGKGGLTLIYPLSLAFAAISIAALEGVSRQLQTKNIPRRYFPLAFVGLIALAAGGLYLVFPGLFLSMLEKFNVFIPQGGNLTITEAQPLFYGFSFSKLTQSLPWTFTTGFFIVPVALAILIFSCVQKFHHSKFFLLVWSFLMLGAMLGQNRFSYYFAVNVAILSAYFCWMIYQGIRWAIHRIGFLDDQVTAENKTRTKLKSSGKSKRSNAKAFSPRNISLGLAVILSFWLVFYPDINPAIAVAKIDTGPNADWHDSLLWMKSHTPEPFQDPDYFNRLYQEPPEGQDFAYPPTAYGVLSAWDYGHWITTIARRIPVSNPHQSGAEVPAFFFTAQDEAAGKEVMQTYGVRYVVVDLEMASTMFSSNLPWVSQPLERYIETCYQANSRGELEAVRVFYPEYYRSMTARLYNFGGRAVTPRNATRVINLEDRVDLKGVPYKRITASKVYDTYQEANAYVQKTPGSRIAGTDPFVSPVPLDKLENFSLIYSSNSVVSRQGDQKGSRVEIFEFRP